MERLITYFFPILFGYGVPCLIWYLVYRSKPHFWPTSNIVKPEKPKFELVLGLLAAVGIMLVGQLWRANLLIPDNAQNGLVQMTIWWTNNLLIYAPIFLLLYFRKQSLNTVFLNRQGFWVKLGFGALMTLVGVELYMLFNGGHVSEILAVGFQLENIRNFLPVFLEGVALAFLFVRLKWVVGLKWALGIPATLFALAHIPRAVAGESTIELILMDSVLTALVTVVVFSTTAKSRDIIWLGILHYFMDIAIGAFH